jgi:hypothetical protein
LLLICFGLFAVFVLGSLYALCSSGSGVKNGSDGHFYAPSSPLSPPPPFSSSSTSSLSSSSAVSDVQAAFAKVFSYSRQPIPLSVKSGMDMVALKLKDLELQAEDGSGMRSQLGMLSKQVQEMRTQMRAMDTAKSAAPSATLPLPRQDSTQPPVCPVCVCDACAVVRDCPVCEAGGADVGGKKVALPSGAAASGVHTHYEASFKRRFEAYVDLHKRIMDPNDKSVAKKYVFVSTNAQMNNRVRLLVTGIVLGMLTDRAVVSDFKYHASLSDLFDSPIQMEAANYKGIPRAGHSIGVKSINSVLCADLLGLDAQVISITGGPSLIPLLYRNPHLHDLLHEWFGDEENIYHAVTKFFLPPSAPVSSIVQTFVRDEFEGASFVLGIHLRWGNDMRPNMPVLDQEWDNLRRCAEAVVPAQHKHNVVWFVAADTQESREKAIQKLAKAGVRRIVAAGERTVRSNTVPGVQAALADLLILAECDNLVLTPSSSYGEQAMALSGKPAYFTRDAKAHGGRLPQLTYSALHEVVSSCYRTYTSQPSIQGMSEMLKKGTCFHADMISLAF